MNLKKTFSGLLASIMIVSSLPGIPASAQEISYAGLTLESYSIHEVSGVDDLLYMAEHPDQSYVLTQDIDLTTQTDWDPIGTEEAPFSGVFDGAGYTITVDMDKTESEAGIHRVGLFGVVSGTIANLNVSGTLDADIYAGYIGSVAANLAGGTLFNCTSDVDVTAVETAGILHIGGMVGGILKSGNPSGIVQKCTNNGTIEVTGVPGKNSVTLGDDNLEKGTTGTVGGVVGYLSTEAKGEATACINNGDVTVTKGDFKVGGIIGQTSSSSGKTSMTIVSCANKGDVTVNEGKDASVAGIIAYLKGGAVEYCYNLGQLSHYRVDGSADATYGISGYTKDNPLSLRYCYNASPEALTVEIGRLNGADAEASDNFYMEGRTEYKATDATITPGITFTDGADLTAKIAEHPEASKGYLANPDPEGYPMLSFEVPTSLEPEDNGYNGLISKTGLNNDTSFMTFLFQAPEGASELTLSAQLLRGEDMMQQVELTEVPEGETILVGNWFYEAAEGYTLYSATVYSIPDSLWLTAVLTATEGGQSVFSTTLENDDPVLMPGSLPEYPDGTLSKIYNAGAGLADDQEKETEEDSDLVVISNTDAETYRTYIASLMAAGYEQVLQREVEGNLYNTMVKDGENYYLYFTACSNEVRVIWDKSSTIGLDELDTDPVGSGSTVFYLYSLDYTNSAEPLVDVANQARNGALMLVKFPDNSLFVIDGGRDIQSSEAALSGLLDFMYSITGQTYGSKINIRGWFFSHAHGDHVYLAHAFMEAYHDNVELQNVLYNFPSARVVSGKNTGNVMKQTFTTYFPDVNYVKLHTGQSFDIQGVNFQVLHTHEDAVDDHGRTTISDFNDTSTVLKMTMDGKTFMLLGDASSKIMEDMLRMYTGATLKSDAVQVAHHGINDMESLYDAIAASIAFVNTSEYNAKDYSPEIEEVYSGYAKEGVTTLFADPDTYQFTVEDDTIKYETLPSYRENLPEHTVSDVVLNIGSDQSERNITWYSDDTNAGTVQLAKKSDFVNGEFPTEYKSFTATTSTSSDGLTVNKATITGLEENTEYVYRVGTEDGWSLIYSLSTKNLEGDFSFLLTGDPQIGSSNSPESDAAGWSNTLGKALNQFGNISFIVSIGDQVETADSEEEYGAFLRPSALKTLPLATNMGNHEENAVSSSYADHFNMPNNSQLGVSPNGCSDYWFVYNNTLFMSLNSNNTDTEEHKAFMQETIREHGQDADWKVVTFHHSIYSVANHADDADVLERREKMSPIFSELGIDVVLMGHDHVYTRTYMMNGTTPVIPEDGQIPAGVTNPGEGEVLYITVNSSSSSKYYNIQDADFPYAAVKNQEYTRNITKIDVTGNNFTVTTYRVSDMSVMDTFTIQRTPVVNSVSVTPDTATVQAGGTQSFQATVNGMNTPAQTVTWTVSGNESGETTIDENGVLTVAEDETAAQLTVTATSTADASKSGTATVTVTPAPHRHDLTAVPGKDATCTEDGNLEYWYCEACGKCFSDDALTTEISKDDTVIKATGHGETELKNVKEATCTEEGYTGDKVCKVCGEVVEKGTVIEKSPHHFTDGKCTVCGAADPYFVPTDPTDPDKGDPDSPQTGDNSNVTLWVALLFVSGSGVLSMMAYSKKRKSNR